jgi:predicted amino acid racemase
MFLEATRRRNPSLIATAVRLHAERRVPAGCYVVDVDTVAANARLVFDAARRLELTCWQMTKQFGRNPVVAQVVAAAGIDGVVAVEIAEARVLHGSGLRIGHVGHLVQVPRGELDEALAMAPEQLTVFGVEQAAAVGAAATAAGVVQPLLLRVVGPDDRVFEAQRGGVHAADVVEAARAISRIAGVRLVGVTSFPCLVWDEAAAAVVAAPNLGTVVHARAALRDAGFEVTVLNAPGISCVASFPLAAEAGATHVEPGSALIGETPWHAVNDADERPAMVYLSEVTHELDGLVYTIGGGFYSRSRARAALVFPAPAGPPVEGEVVAMPPTEIDYYGALRLPPGTRAPVGAAVVYAFRSQVFATRAPVAIVTGAAADEPEVIGVFSRDGQPLRAPAWEGRR